MKVESAVPEDPPSLEGGGAKKEKRKGAASITPSTMGIANNPSHFRFIILTHILSIFDILRIYYPMILNTR
jgi:hypothetical protein